MAELKNLTQARASVKGRMTRINNGITANTRPAEAKVKIKMIEEIFKLFEDVQAKIEVIKIGNKDDERASNVTQREADGERGVFKNIHFEAATKAQTTIDLEKAQEDAREQAEIQAQAQNNVEAAVGGPPRNGGRIDVKLRTLKLPEIEGDYNDSLLKDAYVSMMHTNKREALQVIGGLETSAEIYESAWELLENNYEDTKLLINTHISNLLDFTAVAKNKPATIKQLVVHVPTHLKALKTKTGKECNRDKEKRKTFEEYLTFLNERCRTLEMIDRGKIKHEAPKPATSKKQGSSVSLATVSQQNCAICNSPHAVFKCSQFLLMPVVNRIEEAKTKRCCLNCLGKGHFAQVCRASACKRCGKKHNTLLHLGQKEKPATTEESSKKTIIAHCVKGQENFKDITDISSVVSFVRKPSTQIVFSTARVTIEDANGIQQSFRVLLEPGSQSNLITEELVSRLKLPCKRRNEMISGVNQTQTTIGRIVEVKIKSMRTAYEAKIECLVLPRITKKLPQVRVDTKLIFLPENLNLADLNFHKPRES
ncbi:uncharacterized protein LOC107226434 [Neodiprion lecontei]|uniref:Uncharacterized protein LOC107226434 n=1 Tax=Neodiprion lecontei TaxID=441921 RepID=A0A6J0C8L0_NEOLC|nr:uncharacterized protein LOC107226434 [Neodiprion lecontei]